MNELLRRAEAAPGLFYALLFLVLFEVATLFDSLRAFARLALWSLKSGRLALDLDAVLIFAALLGVAVALAARLRSSTRRRAPLDVPVVKDPTHDGEPSLSRSAR
jgi:hypothetical protein